MTVNPRLPTGKEIADLLALCAPEDMEELHDPGLASDIDIAQTHNISIYHTAYSLALYYANKSLTKHIKYKEIIRGWYIPPETLYQLVELTKAEDFGEIDGLFTLIKRENMKNISKKPRLTRQHKDKNLVKEMWLQWRINKSLYKTKTGNVGFIEAMIDKYGINRNSILKWIKEWESNKSI